MRSLSQLRLTGGWIFLFLLCFIVLFPVSAEAAHDHAGVFLQLGHGARGPALANAVAARAEGSLAARYNPAGLATLETGRIQMSVGEKALDVEQGDVTLSWPASSSGSALTVQYLDYGREDRVEIGTDGSPRREGTFSSHDFAIGFARGSKAGKLNGWDLSWGWGFRLLRLNVDNVYAHTVSGELGGYSVSPSGSNRIGVVFRNFGPEAEFDERSEPLPYLLRFGIARRLFVEDWGKAWLIIEGENRRFDKTSEFAAVELEILERLALRAGYDGRTDLSDRLRFGLGLNFPVGNFDYAYLPGGDLGDNHRFSIEVKF